MIRRAGFPACQTALAKQGCLGDKTGWKQVSQVAWHEVGCGGVVALRRSDEQLLAFGLGVMDKASLGAAWS